MSLFQIEISEAGGDIQTHDTGVACRQSGIKGAPRADQFFNVRFLARPAETNANGATGLGVGRTERAQHMRRLNLAR